MIDFSIYISNKDDLAFIEDLRIVLVESQMPVNLKCKDFRFQIEPGGGGAEIWSFGKKITEYNDVDTMFLNFLINGKPFIEQIADIDYD